MITWYCPACRESYRSGHRSAANDVKSHLQSHDEQTRESIRINAKGWLLVQLREQKYWDERWA